MDFPEHDLDQYNHTHGLEDPIRIDIPKGGYSVFSATSDPWSYYLKGSEKKGWGLSNFQN